MDKDYIRHKVYYIRNSKKISARNLSLELGMSSEYINQLESGKLTPSVDFLINFCNYFNITLGEFFDVDNKYPTKIKQFVCLLSKLNEEELDAFYNLIRLMVKNKPL